MDDLVQWLTACLDEDERIARAACWDDQSDEWTACPPQASYERYTVVDYLGDGVVAVTPENADDDGVGQHVARHDPARVLRDIQAKRQIVERYAWLREHGDMGGLAWVLKVLALPYADHDGYQESWRP